MDFGEEELLVVDLECGGTTSEDEGSGDFVSDSRIGRKTLRRACSGSLGYDATSLNGGIDTESSDEFPNLGSICCETVELLVDKSSGGEDAGDAVAFFDKRNLKESRKKPHFKKAPKPPRPPKGPMLNASDLKLVKELSELAARKRARIERMKALRKIKDSKRPTSCSNLTAMVITVLFFIVILFQGVFCEHHLKRELVESPSPATTSEGLISVQLFNNAPANAMTQLSYPSLDILEKAYSSSPRQNQSGTPNKLC